MRHALIFLTILLAGAVAQESKKPVPVSPSARLTAAKTAFVRNAGGSDIPYHAIFSGIEGWGRFTLVDSAEKADIIIEVSSPTDWGGASISTTTSVDGRNAKTTTSRDLPSGDAVKLLVRDARSGIGLWSAREPAKSAFRQKAREDNLLQAAQRLVSKFRDHLEPLPPQ